MTDGVDLRDVSASLGRGPDVHLGESVLAQELGGWGLLPYYMKHSLEIVGLEK